MSTTHWTHRTHTLGLTGFGRRVRSVSNGTCRAAIRIGAPVLAAGVLTGAMTGVAGASTAGSQATKSTTPPLSVLRAEAAKHFAGFSLPRHRATSVTLSAVPLLKPAAGTAAPAATATSLVYGQDVSGFQGNVNWGAQWRAGSRFVYIKATEGSYYINPFFSQQYRGSYSVGMIRGSYVFANPRTSSGANQARYFVSHGGGWSNDGRTLPGALDVEYNPYPNEGNTCYNFSQSSMRSWIGSFISTYHSLTTRYPVIYSTTDWWVRCTGNWSGTAHNDPLWIARYASSPGTLFNGYGFFTIWQFASSGRFAGDQDVFNGDHTRLVALAK